MSTTILIILLPLWFTSCWSRLSSFCWLGLCQVNVLWAEARLRHPMTSDVTKTPPTKTP